MKTNKLFAVAAVCGSPLCLALATVLGPQLGLLLLIFAIPLVPALFLYWAVASTLIMIGGLRVADGTGQYIFL